MNPPAESSSRVPARSRLRDWLSRLSVRNKLLLTTAVVSFVCIAAASLVMVANAVNSYRDGLRDRSLSLAELTAANLQAAVAFEDQQSANQLLSNLAADPHLLQAQVFRIDPLDPTAAATAFAQFRRPHDATAGVAMDPPKVAGDRFLEDRLEVVRPILQETDTIGFLLLQVDLREIDRLRRDFLWLSLGLLLLTLAVAWPLSRLLGRGLTRQVYALATAADAIARSTDYSVRAAVLADDELGKLARTFNAMLEEVHAHDLAREYIEGEFRRLNENLEETVRLRTDELRQRNDSLNEAFDTLRQAQSQLVESEKMAALGGLVAGVAHEINTPLGICVTVVSHIGDKLRDLLQSFTEGRIKRSDLESYFRDAGQAISIVETNLFRAADLVRSFKQVAVDQSSEQRRRFRLEEYLREVLLSLRPKLKNRPIEVEVDCDPALELDSFPGILAQIITNLVMNSLNHAFAAQDSGRIQIRARTVGREVQIDFSDSGRGMSDEVRQRVFEPFFTTKRGEGGTGLGLHITYNQVTRHLGGSIRCESAPGEGTTFSLRFPLEAQDSTATA